MSEARNTGESLREKEARLQQELEELETAVRIRDLERRIEEGRVRLAAEPAPGDSPTRSHKAKPSTHTPLAGASPADRVRNQEPDVESHPRTAQQAQRNQEALPAPVHSDAGLGVSPARDCDVQASASMDSSPNLAIKVAPSPGPHNVIQPSSTPSADPPADDSAELLFYDMDLEQLYEFASTLEENSENDTAQAKLLSSVYYIIFSRTGAVDDIQKAVDRAEEAMEATRIDDPGYVSCLRNLVVMLMKKHAHTSSLEHLDRAILLGDVMMTITPSMHPEWTHRLKGLVEMRYKKALQTRLSEDVNEAIAFATEAAGMVQEASVDRADHYLERFRRERRRGRGSDTSRSPS
ncbi:hypothetical protein B0T26DRAFT_806355 [Lasiosphaeria miniovina]|uniref:Uncharacterized protein n=1 Tax=Lasiosphaeria miniovina TaxID=1954250 RepID=A0AA39ZZQ8_9PEZI|nr:uncharacterized protein B0T26DRAFT_806355 [Lasiosphaeria miniovina]KAK0706617.1 hypothetical protein B0T26DRAFT_806355 [Lasiosphaeria miniovina]